MASLITAAHFLCVVCGPAEATQREVIAPVFAGSANQQSSTQAASGQQLVMVSGRVVEDNGMAAVDAQVVAVSPQDRRDHANRGAVRAKAVSAGANGEFSLLVPTGEKLQLSASSSRGYGISDVMLFAGGEARTDLLIRLGRGHSLLVSLRDQAGGDVHAAEVTLRRFGNVGQPRGRAVGCSTGADGRCAINGLEPGRYALEIVRSGFRPYTDDNITLTTDPRGDTLAAVLAVGNAIVGTVARSGGEPLANATISGITQGQAHYRVAADSGGHFVITDVPVGVTVDITASSPGHASVRTVARGGGHPVRLLLPATSTLRGRVSSAADGTPVESFSILFARRQNAPFRDRAPADRHFESVDGAFEWKGLPPGAWTITARAKGYQPKEIAGLELVAGEVAPELLFELDPGSTIFGRVFDADTGAPITGAVVVAADGDAARRRQHQQLGSLPTVTTDDNGEFAVDGISLGRVSISVQATGYTRARRDLVVPTNERLEFALGHGSTIAGVAVNPDGAPNRSGLRVELMEVATETGRGGLADQNGQFEFSALALGTYRIAAIAGDGRSVHTNIVLPPDRPRVFVSLTLKDGATVQGAVTGLAQAEVGRAQVLAYKAGELAATVSVNRKGEYQVRGLDTGVIDLTVSTPLGRELSKRVDLVEELGFQTADFEFPPVLAKVSWQVTRNGQPVNFAAIEAIPSEAGMVRAETETFQDGRFVLDGLSEGQYDLRVGIVSGVMNGTTRSVQVQGETVVNIELPTLALTGVVLESSGGAPIPGVSVVLRLVVGVAEPPRMVASVQTNAAGQFVIPGLSAGDYELSAIKQGLKLAADIGRVAPGGPPLTIRMVTGEPDRLRVRDAVTGSPLSFVRVTSRAPDGVNTIVVPLNAQGYGELPQASANTKELTFSWEGYAPESVANPAPGDSRLNLLLTPAGRLAIEVLRDLSGYQAVLTHPDQSKTPVNLRDHTVLTVKPGGYVLSVTNPAGLIEVFQVNVDLKELAFIRLR